MREVLSLFRGPMAVPTTMREIAAQTAREHGLQPSDLHRQSKRREISRPRQVAMARMYATGRYSHPQIVRFFGLADHTTSIHACRVVAERAAREL